MSRNSKLQNSLDKLDKSLKALNMAIDRQHLSQKADNIEQSVSEYFTVKNYLERQKMKEQLKKGGWKK